MHVARNHFHNFSNLDQHHLVSSMIKIKHVKHENKLDEQNITWLQFRALKGIYASLQFLSKSEQFYCEIV